MNAAVDRVGVVLHVRFHTALLSGLVHAAWDRPDAAFGPSVKTWCGRLARSSHVEELDDGMPVTCQRCREAQ